MIKVLIADTDSDTIKNFRSHISKSYSELTIIKTLFDNNSDFDSLIRANLPNLIIADIKFFGIRNSQILRDLNDRFPEIKLILYGAYNEEAYLKSALEYGCLDYMYKPVKPAELDRCIKNAIEYFNKQEENKKKDSEIALSYSKRINEFEVIFLNSLIRGNLKNEFEIKNSFQYFNIKFEGRFCVFILRIDSFKQIILALDEKEKHILIYKVLLIIENSLNKVKSRAFIKELNAVTVILNGVDSIERVIELCEDIKLAVFNELKIRASIGIGRIYENPTEICISFKEADSALRYRFHMGSNTIIPINFVEPLNNITYRYPLYKEQKLVYSAVIGEYDYCKKLLKDIFDSLRACEPLPAKLLPKIIMDILISINRYASELSMDIQNQFTTFFSSKELLELKTIDEGHEYLLIALKNFCEYANQNHKDSNDGLITKVKEHIDKKYYESFSLHKIALSLNTTPEYLNLLFVEKEKYTLFDYVVRVRLDNAKKLLRETTFDDDMIAVRVGYDDARHFRSIFRQNEGMTTSDFRKNFSIQSRML